MSQNSIEFSIVMLIDQKQIKVEVPEILRDIEFPTDLAQIKFFIKEHVKLTYGIILDYENIIIHICRNIFKYKNQRDDFQIENHDTVYVSFKPSISSVDFIPKSMKTGFENTSGELRFVDFSLQELLAFYRLLHAGEMINDIPNGQGVMKKYNTKYEGHFVNGKLHGRGIKTVYKDSKSDEIIIINEGNWVDGELHGLGKIVEYGNFNYEGEINCGIMNGFGKLIDERGKIYEGNFKDGNPDGNIYEGNWKDGSYFGFGMMFYSNGDSYKGNWITNIIDDGFMIDIKSFKSGYGKMECKNGEIFEGN